MSVTWSYPSPTTASWNATRSGSSSRKPSTSTRRRSFHSPRRPHRLSVATRTPPVPALSFTANLPAAYFRTYILPKHNGRQAQRTTVLPTRSNRDYPTPPTLFSPPGTIMLPEQQLERRQLTGRLRPDGFL